MSHQAQQFYCLFVGFLKGYIFPEGGFMQVLKFLNVLV
jgi:hypothetical protein